MSLRWRLALALALLAGLATVATATIAYASTGERLNREVDAYLASWTESSREGRRPPPGEGGRPGHIDSPFYGLVDGADDHDARGAVGLQLLDRNGRVVARQGSPELPIDDADLQLATSGGQTRYRTVSVGNEDYRVLTVARAGGGALQVARNLAETHRVLDALRARFAIVGLGVVGVGVAAGWLIARQTTAPLEQLTLAAEHVAGTGDLAVSAPLQAPAARRDEAGRLARAFTTMLDALARSRDQQTQLVQDASHELRTPLTSLRTNLDVLGRYPDLPDAQRAALLSDLHGELNELTTVVNELVLLASDRRDDEPASRVHLDELATRVARRAERRHSRPYLVSGHGLVLDAPRGPLERALTNLADNAAKFGPPGSPVEIQLDGGRVTVRDHGPGIDPADQAKVFDRFYRATAARTLPGSGLGLAIVRQVIEGMGGRVFATNHPEGGAQVGFELPG